MVYYMYSLPAPRGPSGAEGDVMTNKWGYNEATGKWERPETTKEQRKASIKNLFTKIHNARIRIQGFDQHQKSYETAMVNLSK
jgi:hypothetical protein